MKSKADHGRKMWRARWALLKKKSKWRTKITLEWPECLRWRILQHYYWYWCAVFTHTFLGFNDDKVIYQNYTKCLENWVFLHFCGPNKVGEQHIFFCCFGGTFEFIFVTKQATFDFFLAMFWALFCEIVGKFSGNLEQQLKSPIMKASLTWPYSRISKWRAFRKRRRLLERIALLFPTQVFSTFILSTPMFKIRVPL